MKLLEYIELRKADVLAPSSRSGKEKLGQFCDTLSDFLSSEEGALYDGKDGDLRLLQDSSFMESYGKYVTSRPVRPYSASIGVECLGKGRRLLRHAIKARLLPNYDPIPKVVASLRRDFWNLDPADETPKYIDLEVTDSLHALARSLSWTFASRNAIPQRDPKEARRQKDRITGARAALIYLFGIYFYGLDILSIIKLKLPRNGHVHVERYGRDLPLSPVADSLVRMHNYGKICNSGDYLFQVLTETDDEESALRKADMIRKRAKAYLKENGLPLFLTNSQTIDWLTSAMETGVDTADFEAFMKAWREGTLADIDTEVLQSLNESALEADRFLSQEWYVLRSFSPRIKGSDMRRMVAESGLLGDQRDALPKLYDPTDRNERDGEAKPVSRLLFFRATPFEAWLIDRMHSEVSVMRRRSADHGFATVPRQEIEFLQASLRDFRDDVELIDSETWANSRKSDFALLSKVTIHSGPFKGRIATIVEVKKKKGSEPIYVLSFAHDLFKIKATKSALSLDPSI